MFTKRTSSLLLGACCSLLVVGLPLVGQAASAGSSSGQIDVNFFYDQLKNDGSWFNTTEFGDVWQPYIAYKSDSWRPYTDGYWTYTDGGWMFVSYEDFGWAVYHYGRWTQLKDIGWAWVPGTDWSPAWVTWRESSPDGATENGQPAANVAATTTDTGDQGATPPSPQSAPADNGGSPPQGVSNNYVGWAPLPPDPGPPVVAGGYYSYGPTVDVDFGIDPYDYSFVDARFFGAPFLGGVILGGDRGYYYAEHSVNVTNIYYNRNGGYRGFYNGGPRYERFNGVTERPIPQANIQRIQGRAAQEAIRAGRVSQVNGKNVNVYAPNFSQKNVRNGRVTFANRGAVPVSQVGRERPANAGNDAARERASNAFRQQGEAFRAKNPNAPGGRPGGTAGNPGITTTPQAQAQERTARQEARQEQRQGSEAAPNPGNNPAANSNREAAAAERQSTRSSRGAGRHGGNSRSSRSGGRQSAERAPRVSGGGGGRSHGGGGGGGGRAFSGGGGHGGGGGHAQAAGGGHGGGGKKK